MHCDSHIRDMFKQRYRTKIWGENVYGGTLQIIGYQSKFSFRVNIYNAFEQGFSQMIMVKKYKFNKVSSEKLASCFRLELTKLLKHLHIALIGSKATFKSIS